MMFKKLLEYNDGEEMNIVVMLKESVLKTSKNGKHYLILNFTDSSGEIRGIYWDATPQDAQNFSAGSIVELNGKREEYQDRPQIKIFSLRTVGENEGYDLSQFVKTAPVKQKYLEEEINKRVFEILNPTWNRIVRYLLKKWHDKFFIYPAGKINHHAVKNGLAFHTVSMLRDAEGICNTYPQVDRSLLYAGCIVHDMGKVIELSGVVATKYTTEGNLIGHLVLIDEQIVLAAKELNINPHSEDVMLLRHMVLSHHGLPEYGAAKRPALLEAELLHKIDDLDATVYAITNALQHTKPGHFTEFIASQDNRRFYRPLKDDALDQSEKLE
ncbi:CMP-binding-factor 1 [Lactobacillus hominis DSM 23910 = CRBIP 24.179]|uniref:CMP-binding-factor 1 n=2 Tax=Lactobacillus hominis TaxID=1203033 RepID=I7L9X7_9LACO|nr:CMP-binding-factor 1 [Lactobacillus hominis DSM 23910 = CRBIP 24.179]